MPDSGFEDVCDCKVGRQRERYELGDLDAAIVDRRRNGTSLRDLAKYINTRILAAAIDRSDADVAGDPTSVYEALTEEDVAPERRADVKDQLEFVGLDVSSLRTNFVSHQTVKTHLQDCLNVDTSRDGLQSIGEGRETISWSREHHRNVVENVVDQCHRAGVVTIGNYEITQTTSITCTDCKQSYRIDEFFDDPVCECER